MVDEGFGARGQTQQTEGTEDEGRKGDYDANFFADDEQILPFDIPLPIDDDDDENGVADDGMGFVDAREMLSPQPETQQDDGGFIFGDDPGNQPPPDSQDPAATQQDMLPGSFGSQLVTQQGRRLRPAYVNYARTAKKVDVRRLKENMWKGMADTLMTELAFPQPQPEPEKDAEGDTDMLDADSFQQQPTPDPSGPPTPTEGHEQSEMAFTSMISDLQKVYPEQQMQDISTSYCFICLLHLANEKGLVLDGDKEGMMEIRVRWDRGVGEG